MCLFMGICRKKYSVSVSYIMSVKSEAAKMLADTDKRRMTNYNFYTDQKWGKSQQLYLMSEQFAAWI